MGLNYFVVEYAEGHSCYCNEDFDLHYIQFPDGQKVFFNDNVDNYHLYQLQQWWLTFLKERDIET